MFFLCGFQMLGSGRRHGRNVRYCADTAGSDFQNCVADHVVSGRLLRQNHDRAARADDSHLFMRDLANGVAEKFLVV